jgi:hypothetical protein
LEIQGIDEKPEYVKILSNCSIPKIGMQQQDMVMRERKGAEKL